MGCIWYTSVLKWIDGHLFNVAGNKRTKALITKRREYLSDPVNSMVLVKKTAQLKTWLVFGVSSQAKQTTKKRKRVPAKDDAFMVELSTRRFLAKTLQLQ